MSIAVEEFLVKRQVVGDKSRLSVWWGSRVKDWVRRKMVEHEAAVGKDGVMRIRYVCKLSEGVRKRYGLSDTYLTIEYMVKGRK